MQNINSELGGFSKSILYIAKIYIWYIYIYDILLFDSLILPL